MSRRLVSQLAHVELLSPDPEKSIDFFTRVLGMSVTEQVGQSAYLRAWGEHFHHSLQITEGPHGHIAHVGWRAWGEEELEIAVGRIKERGLGEDWYDETPGHGPAFRYRTPSGHLQEIFWEVDRYQAPPELRSTYPVRAQKLGTTGAAVRQIDHVTIACHAIVDDIRFYVDCFGTRYMECAQLTEDAAPYFAELSNTEQGHDLGLVVDSSDFRGRSHHVAYWLDQPQDLYHAADVLMEAGYPIELPPGKHGHGENYYLYFRDPGSNHRVELFSGGYRNYQPDWETVTWIGGAGVSGGMDIFRQDHMRASMREIFPSENAAVAEADLPEEAPAA